MTLLEMGGADDQGVLADGPEGPPPDGTVAVGLCGPAVPAMGFGALGVGFDVRAAGGFGGAAEDFDGAADGFGVPAEGFGVAPEGFVAGVAEGVAVRGEGDPEGAADPAGVADGTGEPGGAGDREGCTGMPIAGASACMPIRLLPMATARTAPTTETGQARPRSRRPRRPDWSTKTGAGAGSSTPNSGISGCAW
ncbi:hypothetical protein [Streptomyces sp. NPDC056883]|uniref:hypothetical protein n=1 Tax=Streptomyces sp. NPDC056883 TaxID=3345959 RepID=UPI00368722A7